MKTGILNDEIDYEILYRPISEARNLFLILPGWKQTVWSLKRKCLLPRNPHSTLSFEFLVYEKTTAAAHTLYFLLQSCLFTRRKSL